jgi:hypothetical protein
MNNLDQFFNQHLDLDNNKIILPPNQKESSETQFEFVKGSEFCKGYYNETVIDTKYVRFYQIAMFNDYSKKILESGIAMVPKDGKRCIRSFLLKGQSAKGACFFDWRVLEVKEHKISEKKLNTFIEYLSSNNNKNSNIKIKHKFYPIYNFENTDPPTGNEINECVSELLGNN